MIGGACLGCLALPALLAGPPARRTEVSIEGERFLLNGKPTYEGRTWEGKRIEGLLLNSRMVQGIFDDGNPETRPKWAYPDTGVWDPDRNVRELVAAMPDWRRHGLLAFTINLQGGSPQGYSRDQPWHNSAIDADGSLRADYLSRLERILDRADELGMVAILGIFYFGQDQRLQDEEAVVRAADEAVRWVYSKGYRNVLIEVNNECDVRYDHAILKPERVHELIERVKACSPPEGRKRLLAGTSYGGGAIPRPNVVRASDFLLLHGNGVEDPRRIAAMVRETRKVEGYRPMPILFNEDDHYGFEQPLNNMTAAIGEGASWGYFDFRRAGEGFEEGYQSVPVDWRISSARKRAFFEAVARITGGGGAAAAPCPARLDTTATVYAPREGGAYFPRLLVLRSGEVLCAWDGSDGRSPTRIFLSRSGDGGASWPAPAVVAAAADPLASAANAFLVQREDGSLLCACRETAAGRFSIRVLASKDRGATWRPAGTVCEGRKGLWEPWLTELAGGEVLAAYASEERAPAHPQVIEVRRSTDGGATWGSPAIAAGSEASRDGVPSLVHAGGGKVLCFFEATDGGRPFAIRLARSSDRGASWEGRELVYAPRDGGKRAAAPAATLLAGGWLACAFYTDEDRPASGDRAADLKWVWSRDLGATWEGPATLFASEGSDRWGHLAQLADGQVIAALCTDEGGRPRIVLRR